MVSHSPQGHCSLYNNSESIDVHETWYGVVLICDWKVMLCTEITCNCCLLVIRIIITTWM